MLSSSRAKKLLAFRIVACHEGDKMAKTVFVELHVKWACEVGMCCTSHDVTLRHDESDVVTR